MTGDVFVSEKKAMDRGDEGCCLDIILYKTLFYLMSNSTKISIKLDWLVHLISRDVDQEILIEPINN